MHSASGFLENMKDIGDVIFSRSVSIVDLRKRVQKCAEFEAVIRRIDFSIHQLRRGAIFLLDDCAEFSLGIAGNSAITRGIWNDACRKCCRRVGSAVRVEKRCNRGGRDQRTIAAEHEQFTCPINIQKQGARLIDGVSSSKLWRLPHEFNIRSTLEMRSNDFFLMSNHQNDSLDPNSRNSINNPFNKRLAECSVHDFGQIAVHASSLPCGQDDSSRRMKTRRSTRRCTWRS